MTVGLESRLRRMESIVGRYGNDDPWCACKNLAVAVHYPEEPWRNHSDTGPCQYCGLKRREVIINVVYER
jgi:hypothetical protein